MEFSIDNTLIDNIYLIKNELNWEIKVYLETSSTNLLKAELKWAYTNSIVNVLNPEKFEKTLATYFDPLCLQYVN